MDAPQLMNIQAGSDPNQAMVLIYGYTNERLNHPACFTSQLALLTQPPAPAPDGCVRGQ